MLKVCAAIIKNKKCKYFDCNGITIGRCELVQLRVVDTLVSQQSRAPSGWSMFKYSVPCHLCKSSLTSSQEVWAYVTEVTEVGGSNM